jgi:hypothetical protein
MSQCKCGRPCTCPPFAPMRGRDPTAGARGGLLVLGLLALLVGSAESPSTSRLATPAPPPPLPPRSVKALPEPLLVKVKHDPQPVRIEPTSPAPDATFASTALTPARSPGDRCAAFVLIVILLIAGATGVGLYRLFTMTSTNSGKPSLVAPQHDAPVRVPQRGRR